MRVLIEWDMDARDRDALQSALDATSALDEQYLRAHPETPRLGAAGIRYAREPRTQGLPGPELFSTVPVVLGRGWGDCDDLAPWLAAEMRVDGIDDARAMPVLRGRSWHVVVRAGGVEYDPSADLGMHDL